MADREQPSRGWLIVAAALGLVGVLLLVSFWGHALWYDHLATERTTAQIVRVEGHGNKARASNTDYCPVLRWTIGEQIVEHESPGCRDGERDFTVGETVAIRYDPDDPSKVFLATWWSIYNLAILTTPVALFLLLLGWSLVRAYRYRVKVARGEIDPVAAARERAQRRRRR